MLSPSSRATSKQSLSPRPEKQTTITSSWLRRLARRIAFDHGVRRFQGRQDPFEAGTLVKALQGVVVADAGVVHPAAVLPVAVFGADAGIIEARRRSNGRPRFGRPRLAAHN